MSEGHNAPNLVDHGSRPPRRKRQRISVACRSCRTRKSRCDGNTPCSTCYDLGIDCQYEQPSQPAGIVSDSSNVQSSILDQRLQAIERKLDILGSSTLSAPSTERRADPPRREPIAAVGHTISHRDDGVDGMGSVSLKDGGDEEEYFGESSNVAFLRFIARAIRRLDNAGETSRQNTTDILAPNNCKGPDTYLKNCPEADIPRTRRHRAHEAFSSPSKEETDSMVNLYFSTVNTMIPCIHEESFRQIYQSMWRYGPESMSKPWLGSLNMILAIATNVMTPTSPPHERAAASNTFYERAMELVGPHMFGPLSLDMIQVYLLAEIYLEGTTSSSLVWTFHAMAIKGAYQLGLHSTTFANLPEIDCEIRRRLWYWCVMNDRLLSTAYGRPPLVPLSHVRLEPCSSLTFSRVPRRVLSASLAYFTALMSLTHIMGRAIDQIYGQNLGFSSQVSMSDSVRRISDLQWQLAQWQDNLPQSLKTITYNETLDCTTLFLETTRLRVLLSLRYQGTRILVLRPILSQLLELSCEPTSSQSAWLQNHGTVLLMDLIHGCRDILELSKKILGASREDKNILGAWWFSCYYTFNASLAVLGVLITQRTFMNMQNSLSISHTELRAMLGTAMDILHDLDGGSKTITRCRDTLAKLLAVIDSNGDTIEFPATRFILSPSSLWAWQGLDPGLLGFEGSLGLEPSTTAMLDSSQLQGEHSIDF